MADEIVAFFLSLGIVGALVAWGFACNVWQQPDSADEHASSADFIRESSALLNEWWKR